MAARGRVGAEEHSRTPRSQEFKNHVVCQPNAATQPYLAGQSPLPAFVIFAHGPASVDRHFANPAASRSCVVDVSTLDVQLSAVKNCTYSS